MNTVRLNTVFALLTAFSLHASFDELLRQGIESNEIIQGYSANIKKALNELKSAEHQNEKRNAVVEKVLTSIDEKVQNSSMEFNNVIAEIKEELFKENALFSKDEENTFSSTLAELSKKAHDKFAALKELCKKATTTSNDVTHTVNDVAITQKV